MTKTDAAAQTLAGINPDVALESYTMNITTLQGFELFKSSLVRRGSKGTLESCFTSCTVLVISRHLHAQGHRPGV